MSPSVFCFGLLCVAPRHQFHGWVLLPFALWGLASIVPPLMTFPQYAEFRDAGLFLRSGVRTALIPYASLLAVRRTGYAPPVGYVSTTEPLRVIGEGRKGVTIAVEQESEFLDEVLRRCPQLERWSFNLRRRQTWR